MNNLLSGCGFGGFLSGGRLNDSLISVFHSDGECFYRSRSVHFDP